VYLGFKGGRERGVWFSILARLQQRKKLRMSIVLADSTTFKVHRHGGGEKGGSVQEERIVQESPQSST